MKIIALLPEKNESWILPVYIASLKSIADEIIAIDDGSTDNSKALLQAAGVHVYDNTEVVQAGWAEFSIRERLLELGRQRGGTHFIALDADEAISCNFTTLKNHIAQLAPGQALKLRWTTLWKSPHMERIDGIYKDLYKDFIFHDDGKATYNYAFLGVSRVASSPDAPATLTVPETEGSILHFQFVDFKKSSIKQAWYMCSELIKGDRSARRINSTYSFAIDSSSAKTKTLDVSATSCLPLNEITPLESITSTFQYTQIMSWFDQYGIEFFEPLQLWHVQELQSEFMKRTSRTPKSKTYPKLLLQLNDIKNKIKNLYAEKFR